MLLTAIISAILSLIFSGLCFIFDIGLAVYSYIVSAVLIVYAAVFSIKALVQLEEKSLAIVSFLITLISIAILTVIIPLTKGSIIDTIMCNFGSSCTF